jgi:hypothetical protein
MPVVVGVVVSPSDADAVVVVLLVVGSSVVELDSDAAGVAASPHAITRVGTAHRNDRSPSIAWV